MTLQQLQYFVAAARHGSFSAAAKSLYLAQPSLSEQVRQLEAELGVDLFARVGRGLALTEAGRTFLPEAERVLADADRARESVAAVRELRHGTLSFGSFGSARWYRLADVIAELRERHPGVRVRAVGQNSSEVADAVRSGELEAAVVVLPIDDRALDIRPVIRDEVLFVSSDPERAARRMSIRRLATAPLILYDARWGDDDPTRRQLAERAQRAGVRLEPVVEVEDLEVALDLAARGVGDTIADRAIVEGGRLPEGLHSTSFSEPLYNAFAFISRRGAHLSPAAREVMATVERAIEGMRLAG